VGLSSFTIKSNLSHSTHSSLAYSLPHAHLLSLHLYTHSCKFILKRARGYLLKELIMLLSPFCLNWTWPHLTGNSDETKNTADEGRTEIVKGLKGSCII
jgi:hypothetical protein